VALEKLATRPPSEAKHVIPIDLKNSPKIEREVFVFLKSFDE
jgi:hypothetical protein